MSAAEVSERAEPLKDGDGLVQTRPGRSAFFT